MSETYRWLFNRSTTVPPEDVIDYLQVQKPVFIYKPENTPVLETIPTTSAFLVAVIPGKAYPIRYRNGKIYTSGEVLIYKKIAMGVGGIRPLNAVHYCNNEECMKAFDDAEKPGHISLPNTEYYDDPRVLLRKLKEQGLVLVQPKILDPSMENIRLLEQLSMNFDDTYMKRDDCQSAIDQVTAVARKIQTQLGECEASKVPTDKIIESFKDQLALAKTKDEWQASRIKTLEDELIKSDEEIAKWKKKWLESESLEQRTGDAMGSEIKKLKTAIVSTEEKAEKLLKELFETDEKYRNVLKAMEKQDESIRGLQTSIKTKDEIVRLLREENADLKVSFDTCTEEYLKEKEAHEKLTRRSSVIKDNPKPITTASRRRMMDLDSYAGSGEFV